MKYFISKLIIIYVFIYFIIFIFNNKIYFTKKFDFEFYSKLYSESQYVKGPLSIGGIGDDGLYAFAGYYYLIQLKDVSTVNFEHPPLGKYLIGMSILIFNNQNILNIVYFLLLILYTYKLSMLINKDRFLSSLSIFFLIQIPLLLDHTLRSLLDLPFTLFVLLAVYYLIKAKNNNKNYILSLAFWGMAFATRFFPIFLVIYFYILVRVFLLDRQNVIKFILYSTVIPLIYLFVHISFFIYHPSLIDFLRHKIWMISWFSGSKPIFGNIIRLLFTGNYLSPDGRFLHDIHWNIFIPFLIFFALIYFKCRKKNKFLYLFFLIYLIYVIFLTNGLQKFILPVYPLISVLAAGSINCIISTCLKVTIKKSKQKYLRVL
jgi:predicted membrane-bound dolichyl-phosphate-mannose-protein mannosyltransferase